MHCRHESSSDICITNIFSVYSLPLHFINSFFNEEKLFILMETNLSIYFIVGVFVFLCDKCLPVSRS